MKINKVAFHFTAVFVVFRSNLKFLEQNTKIKSLVLRKLASTRYINDDVKSETCDNFQQQDERKILFSHYKACWSFYWKKHFTGTRVAISAHLPLHGARDFKLSQPLIKIKQFFVPQVVHLVWFMLKQILTSLSGKVVAARYLSINSNLRVGKKLLVRMEKYWNTWELLHSLGIVGYEYVEHLSCGGTNQGSQGEFLKNTVRRLLGSLITSWRTWNKHPSLRQSKESLTYLQAQTRQYCTR